MEGSIVNFCNIEYFRWKLKGEWEIKIIIYRCNMFDMYLILGFEGNC